MDKNEDELEYYKHIGDNKGKKSTIKKPWTSEEDDKLLQLTGSLGTSNWGLISEHMKCRSGKQCRERYHNHLLSHIKKGEWTPDEDRIILEMQSKIGNQWAKITKLLPGRTDNAVKNRWHATMRSKARNPSCDFSTTRSHPLVPALSFGFQVNNHLDIGYDLLAISYDHSHSHGPPTTSRITDYSTSQDSARSWHSLQTSSRWIGPEGFTLTARPEGYSFTARSDGYNFTARSTDENMTEFRKFLETWDNDNPLFSHRSKTTGTVEDIDSSPRRLMEGQEYESCLKRLDVSPRLDIDFFQQLKRHRMNGWEITPDESNNNNNNTTGKAICWTPASKSMNFGDSNKKQKTNIENDVDVLSMLSARSLS
jgi:hypothetical protein